MATSRAKYKGASVEVTSSGKLSVRFRVRRGDKVVRRSITTEFLDTPEGRELAQELAARVATNVARGQLASLGGRLRAFDCTAFRPCVYFLAREGRVVYVGRTENLVRRLGDHRCRTGIEFDSVFYVPMEAEACVAEEAKWILELQPTMNRNGRNG
jgi:hypothetical protein